MAVSSSAEIRRRAMDLLARREHSVRELRRKLELRFDDGDCIVLVLAKLVDDNLLSDKRFAEGYTSYRRGKGFGPYRVAGELRERGVCEELIDRYVDDGAAPWVAAAAMAREKKFTACSPSTAQERMKQQQFLRYRGFSPQHFPSLLND